MPARRILAALLAGSLVACNGSGLHSVHDSGSTDTGTTDTGAPAQPIGLIVRPDAIDVPVGGTVQLAAIELMSNHTTTDVTSSVQWTTGDSTIATTGGTGQEGLVTGVGAGTIPVFASLGGLDAPPVDVTVTAGNLDGLLVSPASITVPTGQTARLQARAAYDDGTSGDASTEVIWVVDDPTIATMGSDGSLNALAAGATTAHAELGSTSSKTIPITVVDGQQPDLTVSSLQTEVSTSSMIVDVGVTNQGAAGAAAIWVDLFVDPTVTPTPGDHGDATKPIFYLDAGQTAHAIFHVDAAAGTHAVWAIVDTDQAIAESDETNNADHVSAQVGGASENNLAIRYFDVATSATGAVYLVDVLNAGNEAVGPFWVDLWYDAGSDPSVNIIQHGAACVGDTSQHVDLLGPGKTAHLQFAVSASNLGCTSCTSWAMADTCNDVQEHYEDDNSAGPLSVTIP